VVRESHREGLSARFERCRAFRGGVAEFEGGVPGSEGGGVFELFALGEVVDFQAALGREAPIDFAEGGGEVAIVERAGGGDEIKGLVGEGKGLGLADEEFGSWSDSGDPGEQGFAGFEAGEGGGGDAGAAAEIEGAMEGAGKLAEDPGVDVGARAGVAFGHSGGGKEVGHEGHGSIGEDG